MDVEMAFRHFSNQKSSIGSHQSKGFPNSMQSAWRATLAAPGAHEEGKGGRIAAWPLRVW